MTHVAIKPLLVDLETTAKLLSVSPSTVQSLVRNRDLPPPRKISGNRVGWLLREIEEFAETRPASDIAPPENTGAAKPHQRAA